MQNDNLEETKPVLPPLSQEYFDDNRMRFNADTTEAPNKLTPCPHSFRRINSQEVGCEYCTNIWEDKGQWVIKDGKVLKLASKSI